MQRSFIATVVLAGVLLTFCVIGVFSAVQVNHLEELVIDSKRQVENLNRTVSRLQYQLESGEIAVAGTAARQPSAEGGGQASAAIEYHRRFWDDDEWSAMLADGNYLQPRTNRLRVEGAADGGTLQRSFVSDLPGLNPITINAADISELYAYVTEGLAERQRDDPDRWVPSLAYRIEVNDDFTEYHVFLKEGVRWHPPAVDLSDERYAWLRGEHELKADDFVFFLELAKNPQVEAAHLRNYYQDCDGIEVLSDHEFIVHWKESKHQSISATLGMSPIPRWLYGFDEDGNAYDESEIGRRFNEHWYNMKAIGVGPYRFVEWTQGRALKLRRFDGYHAELPPIEGIDIRIINDATARLNNLRAGELDYIPLQPTQYNNEIVEGGTDEFESGELEYDTYQATAYRYLGWNGDGDFFDDRRVRLAMTHACNRELILRENFYGLGRIITGNFFIDGPDYNHDIERWPFDLDRAAELLTEAGWQDNDGDGIREKVIDGEVKRFEFGMLTYGYRPEFIAAMEIFRNDLRRIGVVMNIEPVEWAIMVERMQEKRFDAYTGGWLLGWESDPYQIWHSSQADEPRSSNRVGFRNAEADRIIEEARRTFDPETRSELFNRFHEIVHEEQPYTFLFSGLSIGAWRSRVENVNFSPIRPSDLSTDWYIQPAR